jgi:hypothetical protein
MIRSSLDGWWMDGGWMDGWRRGVGQHEETNE